MRRFLSYGTFTSKLATVRNNVSPHVAPIWIVLDEDSNDDIILTTWNESIKGKNIIRDSRVSISVDDQKPPYSFVIVNGIAQISEEPPNLLKWATRIAGRYMGKDNAESYGKRNSVKGELLIRVKATKIIGEKNIAE
ncbi:MAG TPA: PPOX class F420-dependent oxidoreductase [Nitrososphaeraceae archaeon]